MPASKLLISLGLQTLSTVDSQAVLPRSILRNWTNRVDPDAPRDRCQVSLGVLDRRRKCLTRPPFVRLR